MYIPKKFNVVDLEIIQEVIEKNSFVTMISYPQHENHFINHLPIMFDQNDISKKTLIGHMAITNPQWKHYLSNPECLIVVNGPHCYISHKWYKSEIDVPTWNYVVLHIQGRIELVDDEDEVISILMQSIRFFEGEYNNSTSQEYSIDALKSLDLFGQIKTFKFKIEKIDSKFKLSQNRDAKDILKVKENLKNRATDFDKAVLNLMLKIC